ncbi:MAG: sigma 54-interacting transcriptional regulator [Acidobacteriota bacterium]|nr:sigma 54-interacting transcriptional regulator [Acidobacteriota bacterium]
MEICLPTADLDSMLAHPLVTGMLDAVSDGVLVIAVPDRQILAMNRVARDLLGYRRREPVGCQCRKMMNSPACSNACPLTAALEGRQKDTTLDLYYRGKSNQHLLHAHTRMLLVKGPDGKTLAGIELFRDLRREKALKKRLRDRTSLEGIIGAHPTMQELYDLVEQVAPYDLPVLITGQSGVGKERFADALQARGSRSRAAFLKINCAALSRSLVESELFGHKRGAFTGAANDRRGFFEEADGGTLLLDEVGELPATTQAKLLRVLQQGEIQRLGEDKVRRVDVRILAATNRPLEEAVQAGNFRGDLYYRLAGARLNIPPLDQRKSDIPALVEHFLDHICASFNDDKGRPQLSQEALSALLTREWPGNVRELENVLRLAAIKSRAAGIIEPCHLGANPVSLTLAETQDTAPKTLAEIEAYAIEAAMDAHEGNIAGAARQLGIDRTTLWRKLKKIEHLPSFRQNRG